MPRCQNGLFQRIILVVDLYPVCVGGAREAFDEGKVESESEGEGEGEARRRGGMRSMARARAKARLRVRIRVLFATDRPRLGTP